MSEESLPKEILQAYQESLEEETKYMYLAETYGAKKRNCGTPCRCKTCHTQTKVRLKKGTTLKSLFCFGCGHNGFERFTKYDQEHKKEKT